MSTKWHPGVLLFSTLFWLWCSTPSSNHLVVGRSQDQCPCKDASLCQPISTGPRKELLGFVTDQDNWKKYNWTYITTLAMFTNLSSDLLCYAHSKGVRVVLSGKYPILELSDESKRHAWIATQLENVKEAHADGFNIDIEDATRNGTNDTKLLTQLVGEVYDAFKKSNKNYQVSFDVAWSPNCTDGRCYDVLGLSKVTDFLVIMAYDERSQIYGPCIASANSAAMTTAAGAKSYLDLGIGADKLVLGLPWYGYNYPCLNLSSDDVCTIKPVPFHGAYCSDAAGTEVPYSTILKWLIQTAADVKWNSTLLSPYFNIQIDGKDHQVWFDNPVSLTAKYAFAHANEMLGLAFWTFDSLDYSGSSHVASLQTADMWQALDMFFDTDSKGSVMHG